MIKLKVGKKIKLKEVDKKKKQKKHDITFHIYFLLSKFKNITCTIDLSLLMSYHTTDVDAT